MFHRIGASGRLRSTRPRLNRSRPASTPLNSPAPSSSRGTDQVSPRSPLTVMLRDQLLPEPARLCMRMLPSSRCTSRASPTVGYSGPIGTAPPDFQVRPWSSLYRVDTP
jgi:hypothetical protein